MILDLQVKMAPSTMGTDSKPDQTTSDISTTIMAAEAWKVIEGGLQLQAYGLQLKLSRDGYGNYSFSAGFQGQVVIANQFIVTVYLPYRLKNQNAKIFLPELEIVGLDIGDLVGLKKDYSD